MPPEPDEAHHSDSEPPAKRAKPERLPSPNADPRSFAPGTLAADTELGSDAAALAPGSETPPPAPEAAPALPTIADTLTREPGGADAPAAGGADSLASTECYTDVSQVLDDCSQQWQEMCASGRHPIAFLAEALKTADLKKAYARNVRRELLKVNPQCATTCMQNIPEAPAPL